MELNQTAQEMINAFAKTNKVSKVKVSELVAQVMSVSVVKTKKEGRKASQVISSLRDVIYSNLKSMKNVTSNDLMKQYGVSKVQANNTLYYFEKKNLIVRSGNKVMGKVGRQPTLWSAK
jgi:predicted HTH transcriptional regulator